MAKQVQTTYTFRTKDAATLFVWWIKQNQNDADYGYPRLINSTDPRQVGPGGNDWCVEYISESNFARGMATGIELAWNTAARTYRA